MFDKLIEWLKEWVELVYFTTIIREYEEGVVLRFGRFSRALKPGIHFVWPLKIEEVISDGVVTRTNGTDCQSLRTKDNVPVSLSVILRWRIADIKKAMLTVEDVDHAYRDVAYGRVAEVIKEHTWDEIRANAFTTDVLLKACRKAGWKYGIEVEEVLFQDLQITKHITLVNTK